MSPGSSNLILGSHFFGSASPLNFWDTFRESEVDGYMKRFIEDGFNSILLLVPWAQFQPTISPIAYDSEAFRRLDFIFERAAAHGLTVVVRFGYLWEAKRVGEQTYRRFQMYREQPEIRTAWREFAREIYDFCAPRENFGFAFMSWEDFYWPVLMADIACNVAERRGKAANGGFTEYLRRRFSLAGLNDVYGCELRSWDALAVPTAEEPLYEQYLAFYENELLDPMLCVAAEGFPGIRMECRVDPEWVKTSEGTKFYHWSMNHPGSPHKVIYYHANIGRSPHDEHSAKGAVEHLRDLLVSYCRMHNLSEKRPFIDQFNFFDDTFAAWTTIEEGAVPEFITHSKAILQDLSSGYAIWGYEDWAKDIVYNGAFELGLEGWEVTPTDRKVAVRPDGTHIVELSAGMGLAQSAPVLSLPENEPKFLAVTGASIGGKASLQLEINGVTSTAEFQEGPDRVVEAKILAPHVKTFSVHVLEGCAHISKIHLYDRYYSQGFRTRSGESRPSVEAFRTLNRELSRPKSG